LYDVNRDGFISRADLADVTWSIYELLGSGNTVPGVDEASCREHVDRIFHASAQLSVVFQIIAI
jgi:hypothetical protein